VDRVDQEVLEAGIELDKAPLPEPTEKKARKRKSRGKRVAEQIRKFKDSNDPEERAKMALLQWERSIKGRQAEKARKQNRPQQLVEPRTKNESTEPTEATETKDESTETKIEPTEIKNEPTDIKNAPTEIKNESTEVRAQDFPTEEEFEAWQEASDSLPGSPVTPTDLDVASRASRCASPVPWAQATPSDIASDTTSSSEEGLYWTRRSRASYQKEGNP
jgi:hypothetical protein